MKHILLIVTILTLSITVLAQKKPTQQEGVTSGTIVATELTGITMWNRTSIHNLPVADKKCAFGLTAKWVIGEAKKTPKAKEVLNDELAYQDPNQVSTLTYTPPPMRQVCPYEKAIELFGQDRVTFDETEGFTVDAGCATPSEHGCPVKIKQILVDAEVVYSEPAKK